MLSVDNETDKRYFGRKSMGYTVGQADHKARLSWI